MPVSHAVQWKAIETMKQRGLRWYFIGIRPYPQDVPTPTAKELQIGHFKEGFATHAFPHLELGCAVPSGDAARTEVQE
jgi:lipid II:glycine glycyltransferase (peptidoglycan interpeptide bridge formation enzyme)